MPKYHLSPVTGKHEVCTAEIACKYGSDHFSSVASAKAAAELRIATGDFQPVKVVYAKCARCGTEDGARMVHDRSRPLCNACSGYDSLLGAQIQRDTSVVKRREKHLLRQRQKWADQKDLELAVDLERRKALLAKIDLELEQVDFKLAEIKAQSLDFTQAEFTEWRYSEVNGDAAVGGQCFYCGVSDAEIHKAGYFNSRTGYEGSLVYKLGVDRIDSKRRYTLDNMQLCCYGCNSSKGSDKSHAEMLAMSDSLRKVVAARIAAYDAANAATS